MGWQADQPYMDAEDELVMELAQYYEDLGFSAQDAEEMAEDEVTLEMIEDRVMQRV